MPTWPSTKPVTTTTDQDSDSISGARGDINLAITNVNTITDFFNLGTPGAGDDNKVLTYDHTTGYIVLETAGGGSPLSADFDQNGYMIKDDSRNFQIIGNESNTTTLSGIYDAFANTARVHGVVNVNNQDGYPANRIHSNPRLTYIKADADATPGNSSPGRIRANYVETQYDMNSYDNTTNGFGQGFNNFFVAGVVKNTAASTTSNLTELTAITITPQIDQADEPTANTIVTDMAGLEVQGYCVGSGSSATNFYGFYYNAPAGTNSSRLGLTTHYSFYGADSNATLYNAGHIKGNSIGVSSAYSIGTISNTATDFDINYSNGALQKVNLTSAIGAQTTIMNAPTNMADGDILYLHITCTAGDTGQTAEIVYETSAGYVVYGSGVTVTHDSEKILRIIKSGTKFIVTESLQLTEV